MLRAFSVWVARNWASFMASSAFSVASMATANSAALAAPGAVERLAHWIATDPSADESASELVGLCLRPLPRDAMH